MGACGSVTKEEDEMHSFDAGGTLQSTQNQQQELQQQHQDMGANGVNGREGDAGPTHEAAQQQLQLHQLNEEQMRQFQEMQLQNMQQLDLQQYDPEQFNLQQQMHMQQMMQMQQLQVQQPMAPDDGQQQDPSSRSSRRRSSRSRSRSRSRRRRRRHGEVPDKALEHMDAVEEERRHVLDDPLSMSYRPGPPLGAAGAVAQAGASAGTGSANGAPAPLTKQNSSRSVSSFVPSTSSNPPNSSSSSLPTQAGVVQGATAASMSDVDCVVVLVCDEDESIQTVLEKWLCLDRKYQIVPCCSGDEVLEVLASSELDSEGRVADISFIIADSSMATPEGDTLLDAIKADRSTRAIPTIMLCAEGTSNQATDRLIRRGATDIVYKPLNKVSLLNSIDTLFRTKMDGKKIDLLRDKGDEYKQELLMLKQRTTSRAEIGSLKHQTLSAFTVQDDSLQPIHLLLIDPESRETSSGQVELSPHAQKISEWISSLVLRVVVAPSCERAIQLMDDMTAQAQSTLETALAGVGAPRQPSNMTTPLPGGTIARALNGRDYSMDSLSSASSSLSVSTGSAPFPAGRGNLFGIECIIFDYDILCPPSDVSSTLRPSSPDGSMGGSALHARSMSSEGQALIQRILNQSSVTPIILLVDDMAELNTEYLHLLKNCSVTFVVKPPGKDILSQKVGLLVESIQTHRAKLRFAYRAQSYRVLLQRMRERKKKLGLSNRDTLNGRQQEQQKPHGSLSNLSIGEGGSSSSGASSINLDAHVQQQIAQPTHGSLLTHRNAQVAAALAAAATPTGSFGGSAQNSAGTGAASLVDRDQVDEDDEEAEAEREARECGSVNAEALAAIAAMRAANEANGR